MPSGYNWGVHEQGSLYSAVTTPGPTATGRWLATGLAILVILACLSGPAAAGERYELSARSNVRHGAVAATAWLDNDKYLVLSVAPDGAQVYCINHTDSLEETFMSAGFIEQHVCVDELLGRLSWELSPGRNYLFFKWFDEGGNRRWVLIDISGAPNFKLKRFQAPPGMQISDILFSPDDRYAVLVHDAAHGDCDVSLLILDLTSGTEFWRLSTENLNFIQDLWWGTGYLDAPRFNAAAKLFNGEFEPHAGLARIDLKTKKVEFTSGVGEVICGSQQIWGHITCRANASGTAPYQLEAVIPGDEKPRRIPLSAQPVDVMALPQPGLVLLSNTVDWVTNQLWLVDVFSGEKYMVDDDCAGFSLADDGKLIVRARTRIELRIYEPVMDTAE